MPAADRRIASSCTCLLHVFPLSKQGLVELRAHMLCACKEYMSWRINMMPVGRRMLRCALSMIGFTSVR